MSELKNKSFNLQLRIKYEFLPLASYVYIKFINLWIED